MSRKLKRIKTGIAYLFCIAGLVLLLRVLLLPTYPDFSIYYTASAQAIVGQDPYSTIEGSTPFVYPPIVLVLFAPFTMIPLFWAGKIWIMISLGFLLWGMYVGWKLVKHTVPFSVYLIMCSGMFFAFPTKFTLGMGQINIGILFLLMSGIYYYYVKKYVFAGIFFGIAFVLKFFPVLFLCYFFFKKDTQVLFVMLICIFLSMLIPAILFPSIDTYAYWFERLPSFFSGMPADYYNQALSGLLIRSFAYSDWLIALKNILTGLLIGSAFMILYRYEKYSNRMLSLSLLIIVNVIGNTFSWQHHFVFLFASFLISIYYLIQLRLPWYYYLLMGISFILVSGNVKNPYVMPSFFQSHVLFGAILLCVIHYKLFTKSYEK